MVKSNVFSFDFTVTKSSDGLPENLTNGSLKMTAKWDYTDLDANAVFQVNATILSAVNGTANITVPISATATLPYIVNNLAYDVLYTSSSGEQFTVLYGNLQILPPVTRSP